MSKTNRLVLTFGYDRTCQVKASAICELIKLSAPSFPFTKLNRMLCVKIYSNIQLYHCINQQFALGSYTFKTTSIFPIHNFLLIKKYDISLSFVCIDILYLFIPMFPY